MAKKLAKGEALTEQQLFLLERFGNGALEEAMQGPGIAYGAGAPSAASSRRVIDLSRGGAGRGGSVIHTASSSLGKRGRDSGPPEPPASRISLADKLSMSLDDLAKLNKGGSGGGSGSGSGSGKAKSGAGAKLAASLSKRGGAGTSKRR